MDLFNYTIHFLTFFLTGLAVNLTPCVYPMLTVTVSLFNPRDGKPAGTAAAFSRALVYVLGMVVMYSALGLFAAMTGALFGGILQNKVIVLAVALLMLILALSMFGVFQFTLPAGFMQRLDKLRNLKYGGLFFSGMLVGVFAAPCIGPPVVALLTSVADRGNLLFGFFSFFIFSLGLGLPYLILGTFSNLLRRLPKAGSWLILVEHLFGLILLGFFFYYLAIALNPKLIPRVVPVMLTVGGIYFGVFERAGRANVIITRLRWLASAGAVIMGLAMLGSLAAPKEGLVWEEYSPARVTAAALSKQPVVIDFYADWCIACHELDNFVFKNPEVAKELKNFVRLRVDATDMSAPSVEKILQQYDVFGLPIVVFLDIGGHEVKEARVIGYVPPSEFLKSLKLVLERSSL